MQAEVEKTTSRRCGALPFMFERCDMLYSMYAHNAELTGIDVKNLDDPEHFMRKMSDFRKNIYVDTHSMSGASIEAACNILGENMMALYNR